MLLSSDMKQALSQVFEAQRHHKYMFLWEKSV